MALHFTVQCTMVVCLTACCTTALCPTAEVATAPYPRHSLLCAQITQSNAPHCLYHPSSIPHVAYFNRTALHPTARPTAALCFSSCLTPTVLLSSAHQSAPCLTAHFTYITVL